LDAIGSLTPDHFTPSQKLSQLKTMTHPDNVHYTQTAYKRLTDKVINEVAASVNRQVTKPVPVAKTVRWRGFVTSPGFGSVSAPVMGPPPQPAVGPPMRPHYGGRGGDGALCTVQQSHGAAQGRQYHPYRRN